VAPQIVYLSSLESIRFEPVRECRILESLTFDTGKVAVLAALRPPVPGQDVDRTEDLDEVVLTPRFEGASVAPIDQFPCFVFITVPRQALGTLTSPIRKDDLEIIAWGELYRSRDDAATHAFG
jgi:hypothetical protein